jgi:hypothetical protein
VENSESTNAENGTRPPIEPDRTDGPETTGTDADYFKTLLNGTAFDKSHLRGLPLLVRMKTRYGALDKRNYSVSQRVLERLLLRHAILREMERTEAGYQASKTFYPRTKGIPADNSNKNGTDDDGKKDSKADDRKEAKAASKSLAKECEPVARRILDAQELKSERDVRSYRLATTDLFVEKAIAYLEHDYKQYIRVGYISFVLGALPIVAGILASALILFPETTPSVLRHFGLDKLAELIPKPRSAGFGLFTNSTEAWVELLSAFIRSFTFFGFLMIFTVYCLRLGKAMMDQAERLRERRHSLRQGRLFIHLEDGQVSADEFLRAFDWNVSKGNAFGKLQTEASAPWGVVLRDAIRNIGEAFKRTPSPTEK